MRAKTIALMPGVLTEQYNKGFKHETNDCTVLALSNALDIPYETAHSYIKTHGKRKEGKGISFYGFMMCHKAKLQEDFNISFWDNDEKKFNTVNRLIRFGNRQATYLVLVNGHLTCVKEGRIVDRFAKNWRIRKVWEVIKRKNYETTI